jgi:galactokinase
MANLSEREQMVVALFGAAFGHEPALAVAAPGRVNLIGEHTDYNQGFVLPVAIDRQIIIAVAPREDRCVLLQASNLAAQDEFSLDAIDHDDEQPWSNYQRGVAWQLQQAGHTLRGMDALIWGDVPIGSGLSSSAAAEVATAYAFQLLNGLEIDRVQLALLCQRAEKEFVGVECGVMDQLIAVLGKRDHALLIDCQDLSTEQVPLPSKVSIVVADTMQRRDLVRSEYNVRRQECQQGADLLGVKSLREVSVKELAEHEHDLSSPIRQRCRHVIYENQRVLEGVAALKQGDLEEFGRLMKESHRSLRDDYQVSSRELDLLVEAAGEVEGVYGSRLTGAGFGGCIVSLVSKEAVESFKAQVSERYQTATGTTPRIYVCRAEDGVSYRRIIPSEVRR